MFVFFFLYNKIRPLPSGSISPVKSLKMTQSRKEAEELEADLWEQKYLTPINNPRFGMVCRTHDIVYTKCSQLQYTRTAKPSGKFGKFDCHIAANVASKTKLPTPFHKIVVVIIGNKAQCVPMLREEMTNYKLFNKAIKEHIPTFDIDLDCAWQHWTNIRSAWMKAKIGD